ncbi:MAG: PLP-dependent aspartate aminotransferase family protein [Flavitalea sp.]
MEKEFIFSGFSSLAIHAGHQEESTHAHVTPVYASSSYVFDNAEQGMKRFSGEEKGYKYARFGHPNASEAEQKIAAMEGFNHGSKSIPLKAILHSSGMAAISTLMFMNLKKGQKVLTHYSLYGGTDELLEKILPAFDVTAIVTNLNDHESIEDILKKDKSIRMVYVETPSNPTIRCINIEAVTEIAKRYNVLVACDNTVATPYLQRPFQYDVDFVVHSTTKFLNGHGTSIGGILIGKDIELMNSKGLNTHYLLGAGSSPFDTFLLMNGIKTLELRMKQHCSNAERVAAFLNEHHAVSVVNYNGLSAHPDYEISKKQMLRAGAILSFELKGGLSAGKEFIDALKMCTRAVSLGTCDTLVSHPASMSHAGVPKNTREKYGITDGLIRMSVGIENIEDILTDLDQSL